MTYHIIIKQERRTPIVTERRVYVGEYIDTTVVEDDEEYTEQVQATPDDPTSWETVRDEDRSRMAQPISKAVPTGKTLDGMPEYVAGPQQLHTHTGADLHRHTEDETLPPNFSDPQFVMVAEWDGKAPYVICHKGDYSAVTLRYAGWPDLTKEQYEENLSNKKGDIP